MGRGDYRNQTVSGTPQNHADHHLQGASTLTSSAYRTFKMTDRAVMALMKQQTRHLPCSEWASLAFCSHSREAPTMGGGLRIYLWVSSVLWVLPGWLLKSG